MTTSTQEFPHDAVGMDSSMVTAVALAASLSVCFVISGTHTPLPSLWGAAAFLFLAVRHDVQFKRIPNWLTFSSLGLALGFAGISGGLAGLGIALAGAGVAFGVLFVPFCFRAIGAGDVKALMVLGALWGPALLIHALIWMILVGGFVAVLQLVINHAMGTMQARGIPFAVCMALGGSAFQVWGGLW